MSKKFTKKQLLSERQVSYDPQHSERMHSDIEGKLKSRNHHLGSHPAFPNTIDNNNFEEKVASERFNNVVTRAKRYGAPTELNLEAARSVLGILNQIISIEQQHKELLENLAVRIVKKEFGIKDEIDLKPNLVGEEDIDFGDMEINEPGDEEEYQPEDIEDLDNTQAEIHKRKLINSLTQGSAKKGHYMFHLVEDELNRINPELVNLYGKLMSVTDLQYWMIDDETIAQLSGTQASRVGTEEVGFEEKDTNDTNNNSEEERESSPYVKASGRIFPVLIHELIKGVMEIMAMHGLPEDEKLQKHVLDKSDFLKGESWDIRLGPGLWEKFLEAIDENDWDIRNHLYTEIVKMPATEFNSFMKELFAGTRKGKQKLVDLANQIKKEIQEDEYNKNMGSNDDNDPDDDIDVDDIDISDLFR